MFTTLSDRKLWYDGDIEVSSSSVVDFISIPECAGKLFVDKITPDIVQYNRMVPADKKIKSNKEALNKLDFSWNIPAEYANLDLLDYLLKCEEGRNGDTKDEGRYIRIAQEIQLYKKHKLLEFLRVLIFVINTLQSNNVVWGVGRGSSVSSYILYLIGVHDVDSYEYELDITDFLR